MPAECAAANQMLLAEGAASNMPTNGVSRIGTLIQKGYKQLSAWTLFDFRGHETTPCLYTKVVRKLTRVCDRQIFRKPSDFIAQSLEYA